MGSNTAGAGHAAAVRRAHQVAAGRIEALREHEAAITATLIGYFEAKARADKIRADAQARTARLIQAADEKAARCTEQAHEAGRLVTEQAEKDAADYDTKVGQAVRRLRDLGETNAAVASMTGLSQAVVRAVEREHLTPQDPAPRKQPTPAASRSRTPSRANSGTTPSLE